MQLRQPDSSNTLKQSDESTTALPSHQVSQNLCGVDQREANEEDHDGYVAGLQKNEQSQEGWGTKVKVALDRVTANILDVNRVSIQNGRVSRALGANPAPIGYKSYGRHRGTVSTRILASFCDSQPVLRFDTQLSPSSGARTNGGSIALF